MWKRILAAFLPIAILVAIPLILKPGNTNSISGGTADLSGKEIPVDSLIIVTPHPESIKQEFENAFQDYYLQHYGRKVEFDWRNVGGSSDIVRYITDRYEAAFRQYCESRDIPWTDQNAEDFKNPYLEDSEIRKLFLNSDTSIGIDLFFGGGTFDQDRFARIGFAVDAGCAQRHPEYFEFIPQSFAGEQIYDPQGRFYGLCLSSFGIACNADRFEELKLPLPKTWKDLAQPALFQKIAIADPTKSGSITKCYEMILQQAMAEKAPDLAAGWQLGFDRIRLIAANARQATDSAGTLVRTVSSGEAAAGMCIDFYGFSEAIWTEKLSGTRRLIYIMPENGSAVTADPIQMLRGAPNRKTAEAFIDFLLSREGQQIWMLKAGVPGGPKKETLLRPCVRKDLYDICPREDLNYPDYNPYQLAGTFQYHGEWTGRYFSLIRVLIKCIALDPMDDLRDAWQAILENGGPEACPMAMKELCELPVTFEEAAQAAAGLSGSPAEVTALRRSWTDEAVRHYRKAAELARERK